MNAVLLFACVMLWMFMRERQRCASLTAQLGQLSKQMRGQFCVLYMALDNFALLNDGFGHHVGEALLKDVSQRLVTGIGKHAKVCRITAGEFAIIASGGVDMGRFVAKNVIDHLLEPFQLDSMQAQLSCSIGIAVYPEHGSRAMLLGHASLAM